MKRKMFIIAIIINFHYVTLNTSSGNIFKQLLNHWWDFDDGDTNNNQRNDDRESLCHIDVNHKLSNTGPQPLFIHFGTSNFVHPTDQSGVIKVKKYDKIELFCTDGFASSSSSFSHLADIIRDRNLVTIVCSGNNGFKIVDDGENYDDDEDLDDWEKKTFSLSDFRCQKHPRHSARPYEFSSSPQCYNNGSLIDIGFQVDNKRFLQVMTICHDSKIHQSYFTKYTIKPSNVAAHQSGIKRPSFIQDRFFPEKDINYIYSRKHQREIISKLIIGKEIESDDDATIFLSRGHLAAKGDFIYGNEQRATFYYLNVMPQWQSFNSLNWLAVEDGSRRLSADRNITLTVYTGTHGILKMKNIRGKSIELYLDMTEKQIPVPKYFYKILIDETSKLGIALICVNNVHVSIEDIQRHYIICEDISDDIKYLKWRRKEIRRGYCYACRVDEFLAKIPHFNATNVVKDLLI